MGVLNVLSLITIIIPAGDVQNVHSVMVIMSPGMSSMSLASGHNVSGEFQKVLSLMAIMYSGMSGMFSVSAIMSKEMFSKS